MKKILIVALSIILVSCTVNENPEKQENPKRIKYVEATSVNGYLYQIIKVDSQEFFCNSRGGIIKLEHGRN